MKSTHEKRKIKFGKVGLPENAFNPRETTFRATMFVDLDVLDKIREAAKYRGLVPDLHQPDAAGRGLRERAGG